MLPPNKKLREVPPSDRVIAIIFGGASLILFGSAAIVAQHEYQIAVNPRVMGHIERTWIIVRRNRQVRVADFTFNVTNAGKSTICLAVGRDIGNGSFEAKPGDSIELSPTPESCAGPYVINIQPPILVMGSISAIIVAMSVCCALMAWGVLSDPAMWPGSWVHRWHRWRFGV